MILPDRVPQHPGRPSLQPQMISINMNGFQFVCLILVSRDHRRTEIEDRDRELS
jgi:hypothetical protein